MQLHYLLKTLILPPASLFLLALAGLLLLWRWRRLGVTLLAGSLLGLWLLATPQFSGFLLRQLWDQYPPLAQAGVDEAGGARAIVVLGGGQRNSAGEFGGAPTIKAISLERLRYGAWLQRRSGLPLLVTGGRVYSAMAESEAQMMAAIVQQEWGGGEVWQEDGSRTTWENAANAATLLRARGISHILLVTHSWHMPRAAWSFRQQGLEVIPAGVGYPGVDSASLNPWLEWLPSASALTNSYYACHEWLGLLTYRWQHG
ncbi:YdcF family protein [Pseudomaricurvus sp. HS19]|uniref:YdcF family protein n=1 Tax=Pseudomaricurvus sp. HS19 TaxID=2692626 RepID=UPI00136F120A|nr:YdcF family protein [Pseudomaricurvus sp. HS19]